MTLTDATQGRPTPRSGGELGQHCYKATSNGVADEKDLDAIAKSIGSVYEHAAFVGSLVLPEGDRRRPTSWQKMPREWFPW